MTPVARLDRAGPLLVAVLALAVLWLPPVQPATDLPTHVMVATWVLHPEVAHPSLALHPAWTSQLSLWLFAPFVLHLPVGLAGKLGLSLLSLLHVLQSIRLGRRFGVAPVDAALWSLPVLFGFAFAMGFVNFALAWAVGLGLMVAVVDLWERPATRLRALALPALRVAAWSLLTAHAHVILWGMFVVQSVVLGPLAGASPTAGPGRLARGALLAVLHLPAAALGWRAMTLLQGPLRQDLPEEALEGVRLPLLEQLANVVACGPGGWSHLAWAVAAVWFAGLVQAMRAGTRAPGDPRRWAVLITVAGWLLCYALVPFHMGGWSFAQPRPLMLLWGLPPLLVPWLPARPGLRAALCGVLALWLAATLAAVLPAGRAVRQALARVDAGDATGRLLVLRAPAPVWAASRWVEPLHHVPSYAAMRGGVMQHMTRFNPGMHWASVQPDGTDWQAMPPEFIGRALDCTLQADCREQAARLVDRTAVQAHGFDRVLVSSVEPGADLCLQLQRRGLRPVAPHTPCALEPRTFPLRVRWQGAAPPRGASLALGWPATWGILASVPVPVPGEPVELTLPAAGPWQWALVDSAGQVLDQGGVDIPVADAPFDLTLP